MIERFDDPLVLALLVAIPALALWYGRRGRAQAGALRYSSLAPVRQADRRRSGRARHLLFALRLLTVLALVVAVARPQRGLTAENVTTEGIDIVLALDLSSSMLAEDIAPNRVEAVKAVAASFVRGRRNDRIGLVVFAAGAFTQAPLTLDYGIVTTLIDELAVGVIEDGTAIGMGLATAVKRLRDSEAASKVVVLLTDGQNNRGEIDPMTAAQMAQALGVRVYAIGAGTRGVARVPIDDPRFGRQYAQVRVDIDEATLQEVAASTGGRYFRATDRESLERIYEAIDALETTEIEVEQFARYGELFHLPLGLALAALVLEIGLARTVLRRLP